VIKIPTGFAGSPVIKKCKQNVTEVIGSQAQEQVPLRDPVIKILTGLIKKFNQKVTEVMQAVVIGTTVFAIMSTVVLGMACIMGFFARLIDLGLSLDWWQQAGVVISCTWIIYYLR
jgi:hypothetical protein